MSVHLILGYVDRRLDKLEEKHDSPLKYFAVERSNLECCRRTVMRPI